MHNHPTRDIKPEGECPSCDLYHKLSRDRDEVRKFASSTLLAEFKRRHGDTVLYEVESERILEVFGLERIKQFLKEGYGLATRKSR
jgi:hypothetical protein